MHRAESPEPGQPHIRGASTPIPVVALTQAPLSPAWGLNHTPEIDMDDATRALLAEIEADRQETEQVLAELDAAIEAYGRSIERGLALAAEMRNVAAQLEEWFC
jgi:hypothetical protein